MRLTRRLLTAAILVAGLLADFPAFAAPVAGPPVNQASFLPPEFPQYGIARGAMFAVFGQQMGPAELVVVEAFPVPLELAGTSVQVTVDGRTLDCPVIFTSSGQLAAILPSETPLGEGTLTVTYQGETSPPAPLTVVDSAVGLFTLRQDGQGPGVFTDPAFAVNTVVNAFAPGGVATAWVTGLGPRTPDDRPVPQDLKDELDLEVLVGDLQADVLYAGPSGCCAGVDQIAFEIPEGIEGCFAPVAVCVGDSVSNFASMSIASEGTTCSDPHGFGVSQIEQMREEGELTVGFLTLSQSFSSSALLNPPEEAAVGVEGPAPVNGLGEPSNIASFSVVNYSFDAWSQASRPLALDSGTFQYRVIDDDLRDPFAPERLTPTGEVVLLFDGAEPPDVRLNDDNGFVSPVGPEVFVSPPPNFREVVFEDLGVVGYPKSSEWSWTLPRGELDDHQRRKLAIWEQYDLLALEQRQDALWQGAQPGEPFALDVTSEAPLSDPDRVLLFTGAHFRNPVAPPTGYSWSAFSIRPSDSDGRFSLGPPATDHLPPPASFGPGFLNLRAADVETPKIEINDPNAPIDLLVVVEDSSVRRDYLAFDALTATGGFFGENTGFAVNCNSLFGFDAWVFSCAANAPATSFTLNLGDPDDSFTRIFESSLEDQTRFDIVISGDDHERLLEQNVCELFLEVQTQESRGGWSRGSAPPSDDDWRLCDDAPFNLR